MIWFIILGSLLAICILFIIFSNIGDWNSKNPFIKHFGDNESTYSFIGWLFGSIFGGIIFIMLIISLQVPEEERLVINKYESVKALVESYEGKEFGNMSALTEEIIEINSIIAEHKAYYNSKWYGVWNSEKIGNLEPITFNTKGNK